MLDGTKVALGDLTRSFDPDDLGFETTQDIAPIEGTVGQERAVDSIAFGLGIGTAGFNIFVARRPGT